MYTNGDRKREIKQQLPAAATDGHYYIAVFDLPCLPSFFHFEARIRAKKRRGKESKGNAHMKRRKRSHASFSVFYFLKRNCDFRDDEEGSLSPFTSIPGLCSTLLAKTGRETHPHFQNGFGFFLIKGTSISPSAD